MTANEIDAASVEGRAMAAIFTFKKGHRATGTWSASPHAEIVIKRNGAQVGMIAAPSRFGVDHWQVRFVVKQGPTESDPCPWKWVFFNHKHATEADARDWVKAQASLIISRYDLAALNA